ncbi:AAA family ATPase [Terriglobus sp. ADX1]|uniref:AAA family ATPase n=1 Tax=Terriglobus sp. ADX1 TaxID=2794063 RepID=UPI003AC03827
MNLQHPYLFIVTGGPGAGKTTALDELNQLGVRVVPEVARELIRNQMQSRGPALPWLDRKLFADAMLQRSIESFRREGRSSFAFCDRGIPDTLCYCRLCGLDESSAMEASKRYRYARLVFFAPPWQDIYCNDAERRQDFQEALDTGFLLRQIYEECGYEVVDLPFASAKERANVMLESVRLWIRIGRSQGTLPRLGTRGNHRIELKS